MLEPGHMNQLTHALRAALLDLDRADGDVELLLVRYGGRWKLYALHDSEADVTSGLRAIPSGKRVTLYEQPKPERVAR